MQQQRGKAVHYTLLAGEYAVSRAAYTEASSLIRGALPLLDQLLSETERLSAEFALRGIENRIAFVLYGGASLIAAGKLQLPAALFTRRFPWCGYYLRFRNLQVAANLARQKVVDLVMAWNARNFALVAIYVDRMIAPLAQQMATVTFDEMAQQLPQLHCS